MPTLRHAVTVDGQEVLPTGTELAGHVTEAARSGRVKGRARVGFRFTSLRYDDERMQVRTDPIAQEAEATRLPGPRAPLIPSPIQQAAASRSPHRLVVVEPAREVRLHLVVEMKLQFGVDIVLNRSPSEQRA